MLLKSILIILGCLSLATLSIAGNFTDGCNELANAFASHENGDYNDLSQCENNENGEVDYIIVGWVNNEEVAQQYINEIGKLKEIRTICLYDVVFEGMNFEPLKKIKTLQKIVIDMYKNKPLTKFPETFYELTNLKSLYIEAQRITSISDKIGNLKNLEILGFYNIPITKIPSVKSVILMLPNSQKV